MADPITDYTSEFEGEQMDAAWRRILRMQTGRVTITAQVDGAGNAFVEIPTGIGNYLCTCSARCTSIAGNVGVIVASLTFSDSGIAVARISGDGVIYGEKYDFDYILIPPDES
jgi:hypothetical protein